MKILISQSAAASPAALEIRVLMKQRAANIKDINRLTRENNSLTTKIAKLSQRVANETLVSATRVSSKPIPVLSPAEMKRTPFNPKAMQGADWFNALNGQSKPVQNIEGYWREQYNVKLKGLPFPVIMPVSGYNKSKFLAALTLAERSANKHPEKGYAPNRWTGEPNGSNEFRLGAWRWPQGYRAYIAAGVPPSAAFYKFIMKVACKGLPTYNR